MGMNNDELVSLAKRDPLAFGVMYVDLLEGKQWEVASRKWATEIYQAMNPWAIEKNPAGQARRVSVTKSTQAGITTAALVKMLHFTCNWPIRIFYTLPRQQDVLDLTSTRIDPMIQASPYLKSKLGQPDSTHAKKIGDSYMFFMELSVESRMMPADAVYVDEVDLSNPDNLSTVLNRLDASRWKLNMFLSTPTIPNYGIHALYHSSDMRRWLVKCPSCGTDQPLDWEKNLRIVGPQNKPTHVFYGCIQCDTELTPAHIQTGRWVPEHPDLSDEHVGYHISQMMTTDAATMYRIFRDPQTKIDEFYRKRLGMPYEIGGGSIERDDIIANCFDEPYQFELASDGKSAYYMGVDQGNQLQVLIAKVEPGTNRPKLVHVELVPPERGFARVEQLMAVYKIRRAVIDANPNRHSALTVVKNFLGRVLIADYIEGMKETWRTVKGERNKPAGNIHINRTTGFDALFQSIKDGEWQLPGNPPNLHPDVELIIDHVTALKRDVETRRTSAGETQVAVYRKLRADHLAHSWLYMWAAWQMDKSRGARVAVVGVDADEEEPTPDENKPSSETIVEITAVLAEVPKEQLNEYLDHGNVEDYSLPFPLSFKLSKVQGVHSDEHIQWVMRALVNDVKKSGFYTLP